MPLNHLSNNAEDKNRTEYEQLNRFKLTLINFPEGKIIKSESPDFLVTTNDKIIGIELTDLYWNSQQAQEETINRRQNISSQQAQETICKKITSEAQSLHLAQNLANVLVTVRFSHNLSSKDIGCLSKQLVELVSRNMPKPGDNYNEENSDTLPEEIKRVTVSRLSDSKESFFNAPLSEFLPELEENHISSALARKEPKVEEYRKRCAEIWLLTNFDTVPSSLATIFDFKEEVLQKTYPSKFDRVFLFDNARKKIYELDLITT